MDVGLLTLAFLALGAGLLVAYWFRAKRLRRDAAERRHREIIEVLDTQPL